MIDEILKALHCRALRRGNFTLKSGRQSNYYIEASRALYASPVLQDIGTRLAAILQDQSIAAIGGPAIGAIPLAAAAALRMQQMGHETEVFWTREAKGHGEGGQGLVVEGRLEPGMRVALIEDVITTGGSLLRCADAVQKVGGMVVVVVGILDRQEGGAEAIRERYPFVALYTKDQLLAVK